MPADAPRATADDRLSPGQDTEREAAPTTAEPAGRSPEGSRGDPVPAAPNGAAGPADEDAELEALLAAGQIDAAGRLDEGEGDDTGRAGAIGASPDGVPDLDPWPAPASGGNGSVHGGEDTLVEPRSPLGIPDPGPVPDPGPAPVLAGAAGSDVAAPGATSPDDPAAPARSRPAGRRRPNQREGRKVRQRLWAIDPWSVFKISVMFYACMFVIILVAGTLLWNVARSAGTIDEVEGFITQMGAYGDCVPEEDVPAGTEFSEDDDCGEGQVEVGGFALDDGTVFRATAIIGAVLAVTGSAANVLMTVLLNLINEVSGGMRYTIIREPSTPKKRKGRLKALGGSLTARARR